MDLSARSGGACELCGMEHDLTLVAVDGDDTSDPATSVHLCAACAPAARGGEDPDGAHWNCLRETIWSEVPAVQVLSYRLLHRLADAWAAEVLEQAYLEEENLAWARRGLAQADTDEQPRDSNGTVLQDGDSVTLIKDLAVKGAGFTAKRGTLVKNIRTGSDPTHIEGKVNKMAIMLKTEFLKKA